MNALYRSVLIMAVVAAGCAPDDAGVSPALRTTCPITKRPTDAGGIAAPTFAAHVLPALQASCGSESTTCHGRPQSGVLPKGKIEWATYEGRTADDVYDDVVDVAPAGAPEGFVLIDPGDPANSWVYFKVTQVPADAQSYGDRMPTGTDPLCDATIETLAAWISQGAPR